MTPIKDFEMKMILRCAGDFFKVLMVFKMAAIDKLHIFLCVQKRKKLKSRNNSHFTITLPTMCMFLNFLVHKFFCPDWTVGGRNKNKIGSCVHFYFFIKKIGSEDKKIGNDAIFFNNNSRPIGSPHS